MSLVRYDRRVFRRWLTEQREQAPHKPVGYSCNSSRCPLKECFGQALDERGYRMPRWADTFVWEIDHKGNSHGHPITPRMALEILDAIP